MNRLLIALALLAAPPSFSARVVGVSDGDTLTVLREDKTQVKVRLWGVDAPESGQDFGSRSKQATSELAFGKTVTIETRDVDRYGRTVAVVQLPDGRSLNRELVTQGYAWWYRSYAPKDRELAALEDEAKTARRGLWAGPNPIAPWDWRKAPVAEVGAKLVGNRSSRIYHKPTCRAARKILEKNRVEFESEGAAEAAGYRKGKDCWKG